MPRVADPIGPYVTNREGDVYCIRGLPPEVAAVLFAYVSRSPNTFRANLRSLVEAGDLQGLSGTEPGAGDGPDEDDDDGAFAEARRRAERFHRKWVVGYGHASVAEHATLRFALEKVSILASKVIEDNRLASFTEKSTRYQRFSEDAFVSPPELRGRPEQKLVEDTCRQLLACYHELQPPLERHVAAECPRDSETSEKAWQRAVTARVFDVARYLMPAATRTALGVTMNARVAAHAIDKLLSHPLEECRALGAAMLEEGRKICPTLLRHAGHKPYLAEAPDALSGLVPAPPRASSAGPYENGVRLIAFDEDGPERVMAALLYERLGVDLVAAREHVRGLDAEARRCLLERALLHRGNHDWPPRAFETTRYAMEIVIDYGAYRDIQRHRIATQLSPLLDIASGYEIPPEIDAAGLSGTYREAVERAADSYRRLAEVSPWTAQYVIPLAFRKRALFDWNLREIEHFVKLRAGREGHRSYRRIAWQVADAVSVVHPELGRLLTVDREEYSLERVLSEERAERRQLQPC